MQLHLAGRPTLSSLNPESESLAEIVADIVLAARQKKLSLELMVFLEL